MSIETCKLGPCPVIKTSGTKLPQQPFRCFKCQQRRTSATAARPVSRLSSCTSSVSSTESGLSRSSTGSVEPPTSPLFRTATAPLPGVALQPAGTVQYCQNIVRPRSQPSKSFSFTCSSNTHGAPDFYGSLPGFLPHQDHPCPPCQLENLRMVGDTEAITLAKSEFPRLRGEMLVRNGRVRENWESNLTLAKYIAEKRTDEKQMWHWVIRKWTQDLKKVKILIAEEDGLGLLA
ncbi:uncharacterized protein HMPREF1541_02389 [Cyphellophora europaea CBS 101466]|uniref:Uncharacterized protein n=1 Tax=Cyphellophora europaea (strain CBS 101466) TaxID=1220924 RepID=W2S3Q0_CYPE1|nr:uncharacterized protein HMPREF1541_02389 [Cyphellophora europaea CBS 101466]ETN43230.1 hypothetical protein HMPREF1541_02389 [Cyphellophora europaea CBS 101466]